MFSFKSLTPTNSAPMSDGLTTANIQDVSIVCFPPPTVPTALETQFVKAIALLLGEI